MLPTPIQFETGSAKLREASVPVLEQVLAYLDAQPMVTTMRIEGHTDDSVDASRSEERALSVARWLVENGVDCKRLIAVGFGSTKPIASNSTSMGNAVNWRIAFVVAATKGHAIGGMPLDGGGVVAGDPCR
ncbi:MAG TPA: OmpA family protein [Planctomycetota bacterium]|nr:OmpA family protein [Planctomycetota bacterium]